MLTDLLLAIAHHFLIFSLFGILIMEMVMLRPEMSRATLFRLARIDAAYGIIAVLIVIVGFSRVYYGLKGPEFYEQNPVFWLKIGAFVAVGLFSILPTIRFIQWRRAAAADPGFLPDRALIVATKRFVHYEGMAFALIPIFAAMMARGIGL